MDSKTCVNENRSMTALKAHLALNVSNVTQSIEFYRGLLGIEPSKVRRGYAKFDVQNPLLNLTLNVASGEAFVVLEDNLPKASACCSSDQVTPVKSRGGTKKGSGLVDFLTKPLFHSLISVDGARAWADWCCSGSMVGPQIGHAVRASGLPLS